jgi:translation initiation factor 3 subunit E|tara:strand:- start:114 stop:1382 length:1269 start_codon:yes stop_codon:yes gene_type:complete
MIAFVESKNLFDSKEVLKAKMELLSKTNMVDLAGDVYKEINNASDIPEDMKQKRTEVISTLKMLNDKCATLIAFLKESGKTLSRSDKRANKSLLKEQHSIGEDEIDALFQYAKCQFDCGKYEISAELLGQFRLLNEDQGKLRAALWGKLASDCLLQNWEHAMEDLTRLREAIDNDHFKTSLEQMRNRCWLCHWSLFIFFNHQEHQTHDGGVMGLCDMFFQDRFMQAIQYEAPHLLRYCACAVIMNKRRRGMIKDIARIMQVEPYRDPVLEFFDQLFVKFDFDAAQQALENCETMMRNDFFLSKFVDEFNEHARMHIFETYCRVQKTIKIEELAKKLNLDIDAAEKWIVNLIRTSKLRAKIDMDQGVMTMMTETRTPHEQIIERTKGMLSKTYQLAHAVSSGAHLGEGIGGGYHHHSHSHRRY